MSKGNGDRLSQLGRIAFRAEGDNWNAYYAMPGTMKDAICLGSIRLAAVDASTRGGQNRKAQFMTLMRSAISDLLEESTGAKVEWKDAPEPAPEHERSKE